jgi:hypothetical protein
MNHHADRARPIVATDAITVARPAFTDVTHPPTTHRTENT